MVCLSLILVTFTTIPHIYFVSITVSHLVKTQTFTRTVTNVAEEETYVITTRMQPSIAVEVTPSAMTLKPGASRKFSISLTVRSVTGTYSFGEIFMKGSRGHKVKIPVVAMGINARCRAQESQVILVTYKKSKRMSFW